MADEPVEPPSGSGGEPDDGRGNERSGDATRWAFLPIGVTFMVLGMSQGLGDGGTAFFVIGITFLVFALTGVNLRRGEGGTGDAPSDDEPDDGPDGGPDHDGPDEPGQAPPRD